MNIKTISLINIVAFQIFIASYSLSNDAEHNYCKDQWLDVVSEVRESLPFGSGPDRMIIFAGRDGKIFNCLEEPISEDLMDVLEFWTTARALVISENNLNHQGTPLNYCNASYGDNDGLQIMTIHMPYNNDEINSHACIEQLQKIPEQVQTFLMEN